MVPHSKSNTSTTLQFSKDHTKDVCLWYYHKKNAWMQFILFISSYTWHATHFLHYACLLRFYMQKADMHCWWYHQTNTRYFQKKMCGHQSFHRYDRSTIKKFYVLLHCNSVECSVPNFMSFIRKNLSRHNTESYLSCFHILWCSVSIFLKTFCSLG